MNGRYDWYSADAFDSGDTLFGPEDGDLNQDKFSWSASLNYTFDFGVIPYFTYADLSSIRQNSNGGVTPGTLDSGSMLADAKLIEAGIKFSLIENTLVGSLALYRQERSIVDPFGNVSEEVGKGFEAEMRYLIDDNWVATGAFTLQEFNIGDPGPCGDGRGEFVVIPPTHPSAGLTGVEGYGGLIAALNASCLPELQGGYKDRTTPDVVASLFVTYTSDEYDWGQFGATFGGTYVGKTGGKIENAIELPDYITFRLSLFAEIGRFSVIATIDNLFDEKYFQPLQGVYEEVAVLPGRGREFRITGKVSF